MKSTDLKSITPGVQKSKAMTSLARRKFKRNLALFVLTLPALLVTLVFKYLPMGGLVLAFKDYKPMIGIFSSPWSGLENFQFFIRSNLIWDVTRNTILYNLTFIVLTPIISVTLAILLYEIATKIFIKIYQTVLFLPFFMSWVVVSIMLYAFLNTQHGLLNNLLESLLGIERISWYTRAELWPFIIVFMYLWKTAGYSTVIYFAGLMGIDPTMYEAAEVDGASRFQRIIHITLPMMTSLIITMALLGIGRIFFADFGLFYQLPLQSGTLLPTTDVINYFTYRALIEIRDYGMAAAVGLYQSTMGLVLLLTMNSLTKRITAGEQGLF
jgi:putative aldouronate transport system permease protein